MQAFGTRIVRFSCIGYNEFAERGDAGTTYSGQLWFPEDNGIITFTQMGRAVMSTFLKLGYESAHL